MNNKLKICVDLKLNKKEAKKYLESKLDCTILRCKQISLNSEVDFNRYDVTIQLDIKKYLESKLEGNNLVCYSYK